jgi:hypothetical protein
LGFFKCGTARGTEQTFTTALKSQKAKKAQTDKKQAPRSQAHSNIE